MNLVQLGPAFNAAGAEQIPAVLGHGVSVLADRKRNVAAADICSGVRAELKGAAHAINAGEAEWKYFH